MNKTEKLPSLSGLRAISIFLVLVGHFTHKGYINLKFPFSFFADSQLGVNIFFVISGFLITRILLIKENISNLSLLNFYKRRALRIFPAYYFLLIVYGILQYFNLIHFDNLSWLSSIFYFKYFCISDWESAHFWSLSIEEQFYLFWPFIFIYFKNFRVSFSIIIISIVPLIRFFSYLNYFDFRFLSESTSMFHRMDALMTGCLFALNYNNFLLILEKIKLKLPKNLSLSFLLIFMIFSLPSHYFVLNVFHLNLDFLLIPFGTRFGTISNLLIGFLLIESINNIDTTWFKILNSRIFVYIGTISYSIYLWQQLFFSENFKFISSFPFNLFLMFAAANISYYVIELPFLKLKDKKN